MRISINLASHPFVEQRPLFAKLRLGMAALALLAVGLGIGLHFLNKRAQAEQAQMNALVAQTATLDKERLSNEERMRQPQNRAVLERSRFLNALFARKSFSWTAVMMDLESVLPAGVQVTSIEPGTTADGDINIRLRVSGQRDLAVDLVRNLERSQRFRSPRLTNETAQMEEQGRLVPAAQATIPGGVEFDILSGYNPLPSAKQIEKDKSDWDKKAASKKAGAATKGSAKGAGAPKAPGAAGKARKAGTGQANVGAKKAPAAGVNP